MARFWQVWARATLVVSTLLPIYFAYLWLWFRYKIGLPAKREKWSKTHRKSAKRFYKTAVRMRGGLIKVGQIISTRVDIAPREWTEVLAPLQDKVDPVPWSIIEAHLTAEHGEAPSERFLSIEQTAHAAASFGQVHRAVTKEGTQVALKIRYPDIEAKLEADLIALRKAHGLVERFNPKVPLKAIDEEISRALSEELDYRQEARFSEMVRKNLETHGPSDAGLAVVPKVVEEHCTDSVLCTEFFDGSKVTKHAELEARGIETHDVIRTLMRAYAHMFFVDGVFQSDPHPGNLLVREREEGGIELCILDFGQSKILDPAFRQQLVKSAFAFMVRDVQGFARSIVDIGVLSEEDVEKAMPLLKEFFEEMFELAPADLKKLDVEGIAKEIKALVKRIGVVVIPTEIVLYGRAIGLLSGVVTELDPEINGFILAGPAIMEALSKTNPFEAPKPVAEAV